MDIENANLIPARQMEDIERYQANIQERVQSACETFGIDPEMLPALRDYSAQLMLSTFTPLWEEFYHSEEVEAYKFVLEHMDECMKFVPYMQSTSGRGRVKIGQMIPPEHPMGLYLARYLAVYMNYEYTGREPWETYPHIPPERRAQEAVSVIHAMLEGYITRGILFVSEYLSPDTAPSFEPFRTQFFRDHSHGEDHG